MQMAHKPMKRCSPSLLTREMQIKATVRSHLTPIRTAAIQRNNKHRRGWGQISTFIHCGWECKMLQLLWKTAWWFLKKLKIELAHDPAVPPLHTYPEELKGGLEEIIVHPCSQQQDSQQLTVEATCVSMDGRWINTRGPSTHWSIYHSAF